MIPANSRQLRKLPHSAPLVFRNMFEERNCQVVMSKATSWDQVDGHSKVQLNFDSTLSAFDSTVYPLINCAFSLVKTFSTKESKIVFKCDADQKPLVQRIVDNFLAVNPLLHTYVSVVERNHSKCTDLHKQNVIKFLTTHAHDFSVKLISEQIKHVESADGPGRLSKVMKQLLEVLDWESSYKQYGTSVQLRSAEEGGLFNILEHVMQRNNIPNPVAIQAPIFNDKMKYPHRNFLTNSAYETFQYCRRLPDSSLEKALAYLTTYSKEERGEILAKHQTEPQEYHGQLELAKNILQITKGTEDRMLEDCVEASKLLFRRKGKGLSLSFLAVIERVCHSATVNFTHSLTLPQLCTQYNDSLPSYLQPRFDAFIEEMIKDGSLSCNGTPISLDHTFTEGDMLDGRSLLVNKYAAFLVKWNACGSS